MNSLRKIRVQKALAPLTDEERQQLYQWLKTGTYAAVLERLAQPRPEGFGIQTSRKVLETFRQRAAMAEALSALAAEHLADADYIALINGDELPYHQATQHLIQKAACELAAKNDNTPVDLYRLMRVANNPHNQQLARERAQLNERKVALAERKQQLREQQTRAKEEAQKPQGPPRLTEDEFAERAWDIFQVPEEERIRRRARNKARRQAETTGDANANPANDLATPPPPPFTQSASLEKSKQN